MGTNRETLGKYLKVIKRCCLEKMKPAEVSLYAVHTVWAANTRRWKMEATMGVTEAGWDKSCYWSIAIGCFEGADEESQRCCSLH